MNYLVIIGAMVLALAMYFIGYQRGRGVNTPIRTEDINRYISEKFPDLWAAYKQGVNEGYEQGLRDGQDLSHEST